MAAAARLGVAPIPDAARDKSNFPVAALKLPRSTTATKISIARNLSILASRFERLKTD